MRKGKWRFFFFTCPQNQKFQRTNTTTITKSNSFQFYNYAIMSCHWLDILCNWRNSNLTKNWDIHLYNTPNECYASSKTKTVHWTEQFHAVSYALSEDRKQSGNWQHWCLHIPKHQIQKSYFSSPVWLGVSSWIRQSHQHYHLETSKDKHWPESLN
jgi:hypothetical protein